MHQITALEVAGLNPAGFTLLAHRLISMGFSFKKLCYVVYFKHFYYFIACIKMEKREFVKKVTAASLLASLGIPLDSCNPNSIPEPDSTPDATGDILIDLTATAYKDLQTDEGWVIDNTNKLLLLNLGGNIIALTNVCTHAGCSTDWVYTSADQLFLCQCHNSVFDTSGNVVNGPANQPLKSYVTTRDGDLLTVKKS